MTGRLPSRGVARAAPTPTTIGEQRRGAPGGPVSVSAPVGDRKLGNLDEPSPLDALDDELSDAITSAQLERSHRVVVDGDDLDLASVSGIYGAWGVQQRQSRASCEPGPWMHEGCVSVGYGNGDAGG